MPYNYSVYKRILSEIKNRMPEFKPVTCLDYGAGLGSGMWAACHIYEDSSLQKVAAVEPNVNMRKLGKFLTED